MSEAMPQSYSNGVAKMTPQGGTVSPHTHGFALDDKGGGHTTTTSAGDVHKHPIVGFEVGPGGANDHTHGRVN